MWAGGRWQGGRLASVGSVLGRSSPELIRFGRGQRIRGRLPHTGKSRERGDDGVGTGQRQYLAIAVSRALKGVANVAAERTPAPDHRKPGWQIEC